MKDNIERTLEYYQTKEDQILKVVNSDKILTTEDIIEYGAELNEITHKITALEIARDN